METLPLFNTHVDHVHTSWSKIDLLKARLFSTTPCTFIQYIILGYNGIFYFHFFVILAMARKTSTIHLTSNKILLYGLYNKHANLFHWTTTKTRSWVCFVEFLVGAHTKPCWLSCMCCKDINGKSSLSKFWWYLRTLDPIHCKGLWKKVIIFPNHNKNLYTYRWFSKVQSDFFSPILWHSKS
jgi:hypothetical protein